ncbi:MAG: oligosaccharide flippase family protein [Nitrospira sp.]|nr:oligosaccharide flippase family protein [Nitrospira sp.]
MSSDVRDQAPNKAIGQDSSIALGQEQDASSATPAQVHEAEGESCVPVARWSIATLSRQTALVFSGKMVGAGLGFFISLLVARWLGPEQFGLFSLFIVILILGNDVLGEGLNPGVVRYYTMYCSSNPTRASEVLSNALILRVALGIPVVLVGTALAIGANELFHDPRYAWPVILGLIGSCGAALVSFSLSAWQARQDFSTYSVMAPLVNVLRIVSLAGLALVGAVALEPIIGLHVAFYYLCTAFGLWLLRPHLGSLRLDKELLKELLRFGKWPAIASLCFVLQSNLAVPVLTYTSGASEAGLFAAGLSLLLVVDFVTASLVTTLLPKVGYLVDHSQWRSYIRRFLPLFLLMVIVLLPFVFVARPVVLWLFGPSYEGTVPVVQLLFLGALGTLLTHPLYPVLYAMNRPYLFTLTQGVALMGWILAGWWLIPLYGALGAAETTLWSRLLQSIVIVVVLRYALGSTSHEGSGALVQGARGT